MLLASVQIDPPSFLVYLHEDLFCLGSLTEKGYLVASLHPGTWPAK